jgi:hypothetical protein
LKYVNHCNISSCFVPVYHRKNPHATGFAGFFFEITGVNLYNLASFPLLKYPILYTWPNTRPFEAVISLTSPDFAVYWM